MFKIDRSKINSKIVPSDTVLLLYVLVVVDGLAEDPQTYLASK